MSEGNRKFKTEISIMVNHDAQLVLRIEMDTEVVSPRVLRHACTREQSLGLAKEILALRVKEDSTALAAALIEELQQMAQQGATDGDTIRE